MKQKLKTMNRENSEKSVMSFIDYGDWHIKKEIMTVLIDRPDGRQVVVGRIHLDYDDNAKKTAYRSYDANGKEIDSPNYSLMQVKKQFKRHEDQFVAEVEQRDRQPRAGETIDSLSDELGATGTSSVKTPRTPVPSPYAIELPKAKNRKRTFKSKHKSLSKSRSR
jgi:hypothetical protein